MGHTSGIPQSTESCPAPDTSNWQQRIRALRDEVEAIQSEIAHLSAPPPALPNVATVIRARRLRAIAFDSAIFSDPAWDILLHLYDCETSQRRISVSKLSFAADVPTTTVLRWLGVLEKRGLVVREEDPFDARRVWVSLSSAGSEAMAKYLASLTLKLSCAGGA